MYRLNVRVVGFVDKAELELHPAEASQPVRPVLTRKVLHDRVDEPVGTPVYDRSSLPAGTELEGPAIIDQLDSTTVVPPGVVARVDEWLNIRLEIPQVVT